MRQRFASTSSGLGKLALGFGLAFGAAQFAMSVPASAGIYSNGGGGGAESRDYGADHDEVYQVQRGDLVCRSREACGGSLAIPMNRPGWFYLPGGLYASQRPLAPAPAPRRQKRR